MAHDNVKTISGLFETREDADRAVERLVQEYGIDRADIFLQADDKANTAGIAPSGGDTAGDQPDSSNLNPALEGKIQVSADVSVGEIAKAEETFRDVGATGVVTR